MQRKAINWNPFSFLFEDSYSPFARSLRSSLKNAYQDTYRVLDGRIIFDERPSQELDAGLIDLMTFMSFVALEKLFEKLDRYLKKNGKDSVTDLLFLPAYLLFAPRLLVPRALMIICFPIVFITNLCFQIQASKLIKIIRTYEIGKNNLLELEFIKVSNGMGIHVRAAADFDFQSRNRNLDQRHKIKKIVFGISTASIIVSYTHDPQTRYEWDTTPEYPDKESIITFYRDNPHHLAYWKAMRKLNIGYINEKIRAGEFEFTESANIVRNARYLKSILAGKALKRELNGVVFPLEVIEEIVIKFYENDLAKAVDLESELEKETFLNIKEVRVGSPCYTSDWSAAIRKDINENEPTTRKLIRAGVDNNIERLQAMKINYRYLFFKPSTQNLKSEHPKNILSVRRYNDMTPLHVI